MSIPKKTKYRFQHQPRYFKGGKNNYHYLSAKGNKEIKKSNKYGLQAQQGAEITEQQIKAIYNIISKHTKKFAVGKHKPWLINIYPHIPKTKKPLEVRMGSGKGSIDKWKAVVKIGTVIAELSDKVPKDVAYETFKKTIYKLPKNKGKAKNKYKIIERHE